MSMEAYPKREPHFAIKYLHALDDAGVVRRVGKGAAVLVGFIVRREDRLRYSEPPMFWRSELMSYLGISSPKNFHKIRAKAVEFGLLHYQSGRTKRQPTKYWVDIPSWMSHKISSQKGTSAESISSPEGTNRGTNEGTNRGTYSIPSPDPNPKDISLNDVQASDSVSDHAGKAKSTRKPKPTPQRFAEFWNAYPNRKAKDAAAKAYTKAVLRLAAEQGNDIHGAESAILAAAGRYAAECRAKGSESRYIRYPATWLNEGSYADEPESSVPPSHQNLRTV